VFEGPQTPRNLTSNVLDGPFNVAGTLQRVGWKYQRYSPEAALPLAGGREAGSLSNANRVGPGINERATGEKLGSGEVSGLGQLPQTRSGQAKVSLLYF